MNRLTLVIPTYERPEFLAECLASVAAQTRTDFDLVVLDNASKSDYQPVLERFEHLNIEYVRNGTNLGSAGNHARARDIGMRTEFAMTFHDDDLMHPRLIEWELGVLEAHPGMAWVAAESHAFMNGARPPLELWDDLSGRPEVYRDRASLVLRILDHTDLNFGSTIYRTTALAAVAPMVESEAQRFHIVADRPFLLDAALSGSTALIREPLVLYRIHSAQDTYDPNFTEGHAIALMHYYRDILPADLSPEDEQVFLRHSTNYLLHAHSFTKPQNHGPFRDVVRQEKAEGLFRWRSIDGQGLAALATMFGLGGAFAKVRPGLGALTRRLRR